LLYDTPRSSPEIPALIDGNIAMKSSMTWIIGIALILFTNPDIRADAPSPLKVDGTKVVNAKGERVRLRGVNVASMEWTSNGEGHILDTVKVAISDWKVNHVRLPLAQDRWFGKAPEQKDEGVSYRDLVKKIVDECSSKGCYIILDLHWSDAGEWGKQIAQHNMPDRNSVEFWKEVATAYKNYPAVIFDLYNEPHNVSWDVWRNGGEITEKANRGIPGKTFLSVGMQELLDVVRDTGAKNVVIVGGLDWSYDMSGFLKEYKLPDPKGNGVIYANHAYPFKGDNVEKWITKMEVATKEIPVIVSEFGSDPPGAKGLSGEQWVNSVLKALEGHEWAWTAWDLHPHAGPCLVSDWKYTPTPTFGKWVKAVLLGDAIAEQKDTVGIFEGHRDIGTVKHTGVASFDPVLKTYTVSGSGKNMWLKEDAFQFAWKKVDGDLAISADVSLIGAGGDPHRKACLMIRGGLDTDSPYVDVALHGDGLTSLQFRDAKGAATHEVQAAVTRPKYLRIEKRGNYALVFLGDDAKSASFSGAAARVDFEGPFYVGIGVCAHAEDATEKAAFTNVEIVTLPKESPGKGTLFSTLETQTISSTDRRVVRVWQSRIEAPNWPKGGDSLIINGGGKLHRVPLNGGLPETIDTGFAVRCNNDHGVSPDGKSLVISDQTRGGKSLIYTLPITGGTPKLITPEGPSYWHGWSPDGKTLAYCAQRSGEFDIYTIPIEGGAETRLTTAKGLDDGPEYSPDGQTIFFNSDRSGTMQIWRMKTDGSEQEPVTADEYQNWFAHPSPDGRSLVFVSYEKSVTGHPEDKDVRLRLMNLETKTITVLGRFVGGQGTINVPSWSPDGKKIAFVTYQWVK
jgi:TolB protein